MSSFFVMPEWFFLAFCSKFISFLLLPMIEKKEKSCKSEWTIEWTKWITLLRNGWCFQQSSKELKMVQKNFDMFSLKSYDLYQLSRINFKWNINWESRNLITNSQYLHDMTLRYWLLLLNLLLSILFITFVNNYWQQFWIKTWKQIPSFQFE